MCLWSFESESGQAGAAFEALQTARRIAMEKVSKLERVLGSATGSNFGRSDNSRRRNVWSTAGDRSPMAASPESQTVDSFVGDGSLMASPISMSQFSGEFNYDQRSVNRNLCKRYENGGVVDVSLKDGLYSELTRGRAIENSECDDFFNTEGDYIDGFAGFLPGSPRNRVPRSTTPSPPRSRSQINVDIYTTPRNLIRSLQDPDDEREEFSGKQTRMFTSPSSSKFEWSPTSRYDQNGLSANMDREFKKEENIHIGGEQFQGGSESVSSTEDFPTDVELQVSQKVVTGSKVEPQRFNTPKNNGKSAISMVCVLFVLLFSAIICVL